MEQQPEPIREGAQPGKPGVGGKDGWDRFEQASRALSVAAIPVVLAFGGWLIQQHLQQQTVSRDYVQLAVSILREADQSKVDPHIREWAVDLLNENSPTKLSATVVEELKTGQTTLPGGFTFKSSPALPSSLQTKLGAALLEFRSYLERLGLSDADPVSVEVFASPPPGQADNRWPAIYDPSSHSIQVSADFATDTKMVLRQYAHHVLTAYNRKPESHGYGAIQSGLATYFPCSSSDDPVLGDALSASAQAVLPPQDLKQTYSLSRIKLGDWGSVQTDGSAVWGSILWQLREAVGKEIADHLIALSWRTSDWSADGEAAYRAFAKALLEANHSTEGDQHKDELQAVFKRRALLQ